MKGPVYNIHCVDGKWKNSTLGRRMTIIVLENRDLIVHSAIQLAPKEYTWLDDLGNVRYIFVPNTFHASDAHFYIERYPYAEVFIPDKLKSRFSKQARILKSHGDFPSHLASEVTCIPLSGTRMEEAVLFHLPSRTLVTTDLVFNMKDVFQGWERLFMKWNQVGGRFGPSRLFKIVFVSNHAKFRASITTLSSLDFDNVIMSHGDIVIGGGKQKFIEAFLE